MYVSGAPNMSVLKVNILMYSRAKFELSRTLLSVVEPKIIVLSDFYQKLLARSGEVKWKIIYKYIFR